MSLQKMVRQEDQCLLIGSAFCSALSLLLHSSKNRRRPEGSKAETDKGRHHVELACWCCKENIRRCRSFIFEHPQTASSWNETRATEIADVAVQTPAQRRNPEELKTPSRHVGTTLSKYDGRSAPCTTIQKQHLRGPNRVCGEIAGLQEIFQVNGPMCRWASTATDNQGPTPVTGHVLKRTEVDDAQFGSCIGPGACVPQCERESPVASSRAAM